MSTTNSLVVSQIDDVWDKTNTALNTAYAALDDIDDEAQSAIRQIRDVDLSIQTPDIDTITGAYDPGSFPVAPVAPFAPEIYPSSEELGEFEDRNEFNYKDVTTADIEDVLNDKPTIDADHLADLYSFDPGTVPSPFTEEAPETTVSITIEDLALPDTLSITIPAAPLLANVGMPDSVTLDLSTTDFDAEFAAKPTKTFSVPSISVLPDTEEAYTAAMTNLSTFITDGPESETFVEIKRILAGGNALPSDIEQALFDRALQRIDSELRKAERTIDTEWSSRGFALPQGAQLARVDEIRLQSAVQRRELIRDIYIKMAEMEQENLRTAIAQGIAASQMLRNNFPQVWGASVDIAKLVTDAKLGLFNAQVAGYRIELEAWTAGLQAYETKLRIELAKLDQYKQELEAAVLENQINLTAVESYKALLSGLETQVKVYEAQVQAGVARAQAIRSLIEAEEMKVKTFQAKVQAKKLEYDAYAQHLEGEKIKSDNYANEFRVYGERVNAWKQEIEGTGAIEELKLKYNDNIKDRMLGALEAFRVQISAQTDRNKIRSDNYKNEVDAYEALLSADTDSYTAQIQRMNAIVDAHSRTSEAQSRAAEAQISKANALAELVVAAQNSVAEIAAQLAGSMVAAMNISTGYNETLSSTESTNYSASSVSDYASALAQQR